MKKRNVIILLVLIAIFVLLGIFCLIFLSNNTKKEVKNSDSAKFASEYLEVSEDNVFVYRTVDEVIKIMKNGTGVVYLGYPECRWCQAYVKILSEVANNVGIKKIYYCNTKQVKENNMDKYYELVSLLDGNLQYTDEGEQWIYVPNVSFHINGEIIGNDYETSKDTHNLKEPSEYWTDDEINDLKSRLKNYMEKVKSASDICTECNG